MTDETCGYDLDDGSTCDLPPSRDDGRCHHHTETGEQKRGGRDFIIDESDHDTLLESARAGMSKAGCARSVGVDKDSLRRYLETHPDFRAAFTRARAKGERKLIEGPLYEPEEDERDMDGQHARFLLASSFDYQKSEKRELEDVTEGDGGFGTTVVLDSEYVDD